jgi:hypothetical protein
MYKVVGLDEIVDRHLSECMQMYRNVSDDIFKIIVSD